MGDIICHCSACCRQYKKSEMYERKTEVYPYKRTICLCEQCNEKRNKRESLKKIRRYIRKPVRYASLFKK